LSSGESTRPRFASPGTFRPQGFSPSRRLTPRQNLRPFFRSVTSLGFALQGLSPVVRSLDSSSGDCLPGVSRRPLERRASGPGRERPEHGAASKALPEQRNRTANGKVSSQSSRSPPELCLSRVLTPTHENAVTRVSAHVLTPGPDTPAGDCPTGTGAGPHFGVSLAGEAPTSLEAGIPL
jgi:hypothetical protein